MTNKPKNAGNIVPGISERAATHSVTGDVSKCKMKSDEPQPAKAIGSKASSTYGHKCFNPKGGSKY